MLISLLLALGLAWPGAFQASPEAAPRTSKSSAALVNLACGQSLDGVTISRGHILEMNHADFDEPTLGVVVGGALYFSADSQGQKS